jgi:hypothetical protein
MQIERFGAGGVRGPRVYSAMPVRPTGCPVKPSFTIGGYRCPRSLVHAILGVCAPAQPAAEIPTVAWARSKNSQRSKG